MRSKSAFLALGDSEPGLRGSFLSIAAALLKKSPRIVQQRVSRNGLGVAPGATTLANRPARPHRG